MSQKVVPLRAGKLAAVILFALAAAVRLPAQHIGDNPPAIEAAQIEPDMLSLVTLSVNGELVGDRELGILGDSPIIQKSLLAKILSPYLAPDVYDTIFNVVFDKLNWVTESELRVVGIGWNWDMIHIVLSLSVPSSYGPVTDIDVNPTYAVNIKPILKPAAFSGHIDFKLDSELELATAKIDYPTTVSADASFNLYDWVAELSGSAKIQSSGFTAELGAADILRDLPSIKGRMSIGKLTVPGLAYQSQPEIYGLTLKKEDILQYKVKPGFYELFTEFTVESPSTVRMILNNMVYRTITLNPGNYRVLDLPFSYGINDFTLEIEDESGHKKRMSVAVPREMNLLMETTSDYSITAGVGRAEYTQPFFSGYFRYGFTPRLTAGLMGQADIRSAMGGLNFVAATGIGSFTGAGAAIAAWDGRSQPFGWAASLQYRLSVPSKEYFPLLGLSADYKSPGFLAPLPSSTPGSGEENLRIGAQLGGKIDGASSYSLSASWTKVGGLSPSSSIGLSAALNRSLGQGSSISLVGTMNQSIGGSPSFTLSAMLFVLPQNKPGRSWSFIQSGDSSNTISYIDKLDILDGLDLSLNATNLMFGTTNGSNVTGSAKKAFGWGDFTLGGSFNYGNPTIGTYGSVKASAATTFAFADGYVALSRQIDDSFAILAPSKDLAGQRIFFKVDAGSSAESPDGGPVVVPIASYKAAAAYIELPEAPPDVAASVQAALLVPSLRSGIVYASGIVKRYRVVGKLVSAEGKPYEYVAGDLVDSGGTNLVSTFTDLDGSFELYDLEPGSYTIYWPESVGASTIVVTDTESGMIDLGDVLPEAAGPSGG